MTISVSRPYERILLGSGEFLYHRSLIGRPSSVVTRVLTEKRQSPVSYRGNHPKDMLIILLVQPRREMYI